MSSEAPAPMFETYGARVGRYIKDKWHIDRLIGVGGMAAVYAATHRNGNRVALKMLHPQLSIDERTRGRFRREGYVANTVHHPGVVRILDDDMTEDGAVFLVMELLEGETTDARALRLGGRLPVQDVVAIVDGLLDVLAAAHAAGVVHRDIKPENIFFTRDRQVKVLDFGIARMRNNQLTKTHTNSLLGTPAFMPPEQALGRMNLVDGLSDVWATGATMFTLLTGSLVHQAETPNEMLIAAATKQARSLATVSANAPSELIEVVDRALAYEKNNRWSSARAMQHALRQACATLGDWLTDEAGEPPPLRHPDSGKLYVGMRLESPESRETPTGEHTISLEGSFTQQRQANGAPSTSRIAFVSTPMDPLAHVGAIRVVEPPSWKRTVSQAAIGAGAAGLLSAVVALGFVGTNSRTVLRPAMYHLAAAAGPEPSPIDPTAQTTGETAEIASADEPKRAATVSAPKRLKKKTWLDRRK